MAKIYVEEEFTNWSCIVPNSNYIRIYKRRPTQNTTTDYIDLYTNNHYYFIRGQYTMGNYSNQINCSNDYVLTNDFYYRIDLADILISFIIISFFVFFIPIKIFSKLFKKGGI